MGAVFDNAPTEPTVVVVQFAPIHFVGRCRYCRERATTNVRPVDSIGHPMGDLNVGAQHARLLIERARAKGLGGRDAGVNRRADAAKRVNK